MTINDGGPAFRRPGTDATGNEGRRIEDEALERPRASSLLAQRFPLACEMTLRDYFAAAALTGLLAHDPEDGSFEDFARWAYRDADEMLIAREARKEGPEA